MKPADRADFPTFDQTAPALFRAAQTETEDTYEDNLEYYEDRRLTFIPLPDSSQYFNRETKSLEELIDTQYVEPGITIREMFECLAEEPFLLQTVPEDASKYRFMDRADLNRREVREALFPIIAELESELAKAIEAEFDDPKDLYYTASESVVGRREKDMLNDVELHTAEYLTLGGMIGVLKGRDQLWEPFGFGTASEIGDRLGSIHDLRNRVMHSNRTLIRNTEDIAKTLERVDDAQRIIAESRCVSPP